MTALSTAALVFGDEPGCVYPSIVVAPVMSLMVGSWLVTWIVCGPAPGRLKATVSAPACRFASVIAARSVHSSATVAQMPLPGMASAAHRWR